MYAALRLLIRPSQVLLPQGRDDELMAAETLQVVAAVVTYWERLKLAYLESLTLFVHEFYEVAIFVLVEWSGRNCILHVPIGVDVRAM